MDHLFSDPTFWVAVSTTTFVVIVFTVKAPAQILKTLDARAAAIAKELEEARTLRDEAQVLLASYQKRQREAEKEAQDIVVQARAEAERFAVETKKSLEAQIARRAKMAEDKIAQAEAQALAEVRALAADIAVGAAGRVIAQTMSPGRAQTLIDQAIKDLPGKIN
jgi:F-type H+-transporting ATPase subunit b